MPKDDTVKRGYFYPGVPFMYASGLHGAILRFYENAWTRFIWLESPCSSNLEHANETLEEVEKLCKDVEDEAHALAVLMRRQQRRVARLKEKQQVEQETHDAR